MSRQAEEQSKSKGDVSETDGTALPISTDIEPGVYVISKYAPERKGALRLRLCACEVKTVKVKRPGSGTERETLT